MELFNKEGSIFKTRILLKQERIIYRSEMIKSLLEANELTVFNLSTNKMGILIGRK